MQTFLPFSDFHETARVIDNSRLGNQCYRESWTLYRGGWPNHPASKMWQGHWRVFAEYNLALVKSMRERGNWQKDVIWRWARRWHEIKETEPDTGPPIWLGREDIHSSHRAVLLFKGMQDVTYGQLTGTKGYWPRKRSDWTFDHFYLAWQLHGKPEVTWYTQFGWTETPIGLDPKTGKFGYVWPV